MIKIFLYKNNELVLEKEGLLQDNNYIFDNIIYSFIDLTLIREDDNFKYVIDFANENATVTIKENNYSLNIKVKVVDIIKEESYHEIKYNIESEELIENKLVIYF